jgi:cell division protein FtsL
MTNSTLTLPILLLAGVLAFTAGAFLTAEIATRVLKAREARLSAERKRLNEAWRYLHEIYGIERSAWVPGPGPDPDRAGRSSRYRGVT